MLRTAVVSKTLAKWSCRYVPMSLTLSLYLSDIQDIINSQVPSKFGAVAVTYEQRTGSDASY
jgi:hypothetical protein